MMIQTDIFNPNNKLARFGLSLNMSSIELNQTRQAFRSAKYRENYKKIHIEQHYEKRIMA